MPSLGGKQPSGPDTDQDDIETPGEANEEENPSENPNLEDNEHTNSQEISYTYGGNTYTDNPGDYLTTRFIPHIPYQYQPTLIQFNEKEECTDYHFGLIRGYHNEMYDGGKQKFRCLCCSWSEQDMSELSARRNRVLTCQIVGVIFGVAFVFIGLTSLIVSFIVSSDGARKYLWDSLQISSAYIHILAIVGLIVLTIGSAMVSLCLLVPLCIGQAHTQADVAGSWCTAGDVYVKNAAKTKNLSADQFLYFDAAFYRKLFGKAIVKKIQPEIE